MRVVGLAIVSILLASCAVVPPASQDTAAPVTRTLVVEGPSTADLEEMVASTVVPRGTAFNIASLGHVVNAAAGTFGWPCDEFDWIWDNPDTPDHPLTRAMSGACRGIWAEYSEVLVLRAWTDLPAPDEISWSRARVAFTCTLPRTPIFGTGSNFYDEGALAYDADADEWWIRSKGGMTRINIPADPGLDPAVYLDNPSACPVATPYGNRILDQDLLAGLSAPAQQFSDFAIVDGRIWASHTEFYNVAGRDNLTFSSIKTDGTDPRGAWRAGPAGVNDPLKNAYHANKVSGWLGVLPPWWAAQYAPGKKLVAGDQRGAGAFGGDFGPGCYAIDPDELLAPGTSFNNSFPLLVYPGTGQLGWAPGYTNGERRDYATMEFIDDGFSCSLFYGWMKGNGPNFYGVGPAGCPQVKGWHSHPYTPMGYLYYGSTLALVATGQVSPWQIQPDESFPLDMVWENPANGFNANCKRPYVTGSAYSAKHKRLLLLQLKAYKETPSSNPLPVIHVIDFS